jgi:hypothetical protein
MKREEFYDQLAKLDEEQLKKTLWTVYWRSAAPVRERIEAELNPEAKTAAVTAKPGAPDPGQVREEVAQFAALARAGSYLARDRRVSPRERSGWRFTFRRLATNAQTALAAQDSGPAEEALAEIIDLACYTRSYEVFHSEDPMEAAKYVVSDAVTALWRTLLSRYGLEQFARRAMPQLARWESQYGWTRTGWGSIAEKEIPLATVLEQLLPNPDAWITCTDHYLQALDQLAPVPEPTKSRQASSYRGHDDAYYRRKERTDNLGHWHSLLLERLPDYDASDRIDKLVTHPALTGPELLLLRARWAQHSNDLPTARTLVTEALSEVPGHQELLAYAAEIDAPRPTRYR